MKKKDSKKAAKKVIELAMQKDRDKKVRMTFLKGPALTSAFRIRNWKRDVAIKFFGEKQVLIWDQVYDDFKNGDWKKHT